MTARFTMARSLRTLLLTAILMSLLALAAPTSVYAGSDISSANRYPGEGQSRKCQCGW